MLARYCYTFVYYSYTIIYTNTHTQNFRFCVILFKVPMQRLNCKPGQWVTENRSWCSPKYAPRLLNTAHVLQGLGTTLLSTRVLLQILFLNSTNESRFISLSLLLEAGGCPTHRDACTHTHTHTQIQFLVIFFNLNDLLSQLRHLLSLK